MIYSHFTIEREVGNVAVVVFDRKDKDMNILSEVVLRELDKIIEELGNDSAIQGVVIISGKIDQFIVGADVSEIASFKTAKEGEAGSWALSQIFQKLHKMQKPSVAAIHGPCLGGGLEMSLACTWRVATQNSKTKLGLPEIQLGLIPGAGGTQRLPRLVGIQAGLEMILTGKRVDGAKALKMGLVDACVPDGLLREQAVKLATKKRSSSDSGAKSGAKGISGALFKSLPHFALEGNPFGRGIMAKKARSSVDEKTKGFYPASYKALDAVFDGFDLSLEKGLALESALFGQLVITREAKSLIHLFNATTAIKKHPYREAGKERFGDNEIRKVGIIGAGFMGAGIATLGAEKDIKILISDPNQESVGRCLRHARDYFNKKVERRRMKRFEMSQKMVHISPGLSPQGFDTCDIVIEAVFEDVGLKQKLLKQAEQNVHKNWIFASNTSALPIKQIAAATEHPERVLGMHFFSPVEKMPLLEIVVTDQTAPWATARAIELGQLLGKQVIIVKDGPGFYTTRALAFLLAEAVQILTAGVSIEAIDRAMQDFGFPVGPITLIDEVGIDVGIHVLETIEKAFPTRMTKPKGLGAIAESGRLGRKNSKGFYKYENGKKTEPDSDIYKLIGLDANGHAKVSASEITARCALIFVNESVRCLEEGILADPHDGDVGAVFGLGFPPFLGGPFKYVDQMGAAAIVENLEKLQQKFGERFAPAQLLRDLAAKKQQFFPAETL